MITSGGAAGGNPTLATSGGNWATGPVGNTITDIGAGAVKGAESVGSIAGGIGGWLGKNLVVVIVIIVLIVALKK